VADILEENKLYNLHNSSLKLKGKFTIHKIGKLLVDLEKELVNYDRESLLIILDDIETIDSAGITAVFYLRDKLRSQGIAAEIETTNSETRKKLLLFEPADEQNVSDETSPGFFESIGSVITRIFTDYIADFIQLAADVTYWSVTIFFQRNKIRKGEFVKQAVLIGVNAVLIVGLMSFIIGLVLALQSAAQLRTLGADIYIVDLTVIAMMSEMGPLITAIMVAGRSGSSIAAEIATMKVTNETDALKTMGLNPVRFVIVPKMHAALLTLPFLTIIADVLGIAGGLLIAVTSLDISPMVFFNRMEQAFMLKDVIFGVIKSLVFAYIIVLTGSYFGLRVKQGADGVGKATTISVVAAISLVIIADSIMGIIFY